MNLFIDIILWIAYLVSLYFSVFLLLVYLDKKNYFDSQETSQKLDKTPYVSILVPAYNEEKTIARTLESIFNLDYPQDRMEVIVINDGSKDKTEEVIRKFTQGRNNLRVLSHANCGKAASLNKAIALASGEFFACLDADSFVDSRTLRKMLHLYYKENDERIAVITPAMKVFEPKNLLQKVQWLEYLVVILISRVSSEMDSLYVAPGPFSLYRMSIIKAIGGFDATNITEDQENAYRLQKHHYRIKQCHDGYVYTTTPRTLSPFYRQRKRWYLGSMICVKQYKDLIANKKYGDFGMMQMIKNVVGYLLAGVGIILALYIFIRPMWDYLKTLYLVHFNIWPYITALKIKITFFTFLVADFRKGFVLLFLMLIGYFLFYAAHRNAQEKMTRFGLVPLIPYFMFYYTIKGLILLVCFVEFARGKKIQW